MVKAGAIAATSLAPGSTPAERWAFLHEGLSRFAGRDLALDENVFASASATNARNQGLAQLLLSLDRLYGEPAEAVALYTRQCSLRVNSVRGKLVARLLSEQLGMDLLISRPADD